MTGGFIANKKPVSFREGRICTPVAAVASTLYQAVIPDAFRSLVSWWRTEVQCRLDLDDKCTLYAQSTPDRRQGLEALVVGGL